MSNIMPPGDADTQPDIDILGRRIGRECTHANLIEEINGTYAATGVIALMEGPKPPFLIIKVPSALPQVVDARIIALIVVGYQDLRLDLASCVANLNGFRRYTFL